MSGATFVGLYGPTCPADEAYFSVQLMLICAVVITPFCAV